MVNLLRSRRGRVSIGCLIPVILLGAFIYAGLLFGRPWFAYRQYQDEMRAVVEMQQTLSDSAMLVRVRARADSLRLPDAKRIEIRRRSNPSRLEVRAQYTHTVKLPFLGEKVIIFKPNASDPI